MILPPRWLSVIALVLLSLTPVSTSIAQPAASAARTVVTVAPPPPGPNPIVVKASPYRINAGDELGIYVWGEERLQRDLRVLPDGTFAFPLIGQIFAQGKLPQEIEMIISERLKDQYRGQVPQVTVSVKAATGLQFSVLGRVKSPGTYSPGRYINILEALSLAGGPTEFANLDNVLILRKQGDEVKTIRARVGPLFKSGADVGDVERSNIARLESGDTIIVP